MLADIHLLHHSDNYRVLDFKCHCDFCSLSAPEYNDSFCITFIRKGFFEYRVFRNNLEAFTGKVLISKPGYEHVAFHTNGQPDRSTVIDFKKTYVKHFENQYPGLGPWFFRNNDLHSLLIQSSARADLLHHQLLGVLHSVENNQLQIDELVFELVDELFQTLENRNHLISIPSNLRKNHLATIENAKEYILQHFHENISLQELADYCHVSPFHFSRIFKKIVDMSPHQYLSSIRLNHASLLLSTTGKPVSDIAFESGFNSLEHFATAYKQQYQLSPTEFRRQLA